MQGSRAQGGRARQFECEAVLVWAALAQSASAQRPQDPLTAHALLMRVNAGLERNPEEFSAASLREATDQQISAWLGIEADDARLPACVLQIRDLGRWLLEDCGGHFANAITASKGCWRGRRGLAARFARTVALRSESASALALAELRVRGLFQPADL